MPWHGTSEFAHESQFRPLDRNDRARWRFLADLARRRRQITANALDVAQALLRRHGPAGRCDPAHATIAADAGCSARTVARALQALAALGLVRWTRRIVRTATGAKQTSNAFRLHLVNLPEAARRLVHRVTRPTRRYHDSAPPSVDRSEALEALRRFREARCPRPADPLPAPDQAGQGLAEIRARREEARAADLRRARAALAAR